MMGHLNSFSASRGGNFNKNVPKIQMPGCCPGGMFKLRFDWYISSEFNAQRQKYYLLKVEKSRDLSDLLAKVGEFRDFR